MRRVTTLGSAQLPHQSKQGVRRLLTKTRQARKTGEGRGSSGQTLGLPSDRCACLAEFNFLKTCAANCFSVLLSVSVSLFLSVSLSVSCSLSVVACVVCSNN